MANLKQDKLPRKVAVLARDIKRGRDAHGFPVSGWRCSTNCLWIIMDIIRILSIHSPLESLHAESIGVSLCRVSPDFKVDYVETVT